MTSLALTLLLLPFYFLLEIIYFVFRCRPRKEIKNEHVLITGAAQGIGGGLADKFAQMGNIVHCVDIDTALVEKRVSDLRSRGYEAHAYTCDLTKLEQVQQLHKEITRAGHTITVLVNNAGVAMGISVRDMTLNQLNFSMTLNLTSNLWLIKFFLPKMIQLNRGHVINMASAAGLFPVPKCTDYCAAKAASISTMNQLRTEYVKTNIKFTAICPAFVQTNMTKGMEGRVELMPLHQCIDQCMKGILENKETLVIPWKWGVSIFFYNMLPRPFQEYVTIKRLEMLGGKIKVPTGHNQAEKNK